MKRKAFLRQLLAVPLAAASLISSVRVPRRKLANSLLFKREVTFRKEPADERKWLKLAATATTSFT